MMVRCIGGLAAVKETILGAVLGNVNLPCTARWKQRGNVKVGTPPKDVPCLLPLRALSAMYSGIHTPVFRRMGHQTYEYLRPA